MTSQTEDSHGLGEEAPSSSTPASPLETSTSRSPQKLDDVMMAMDIVDTLRHRALIVEKELGIDARENAMIERLRDIYAGQGIEVSDHILQDGVKALEENRFVYTPPENSLSIKMAKFYIARDRWLKPLIAVLGLAFLSVGIYQFGIKGPANSAFSKNQTALNETYKSATALAQTQFSRDKINTYFTEGQNAIKEDNPKQLKSSVNALNIVNEDLEKNLRIRIVSRPGELSGVFRIPDNNPNGQNYYLIVEALDLNGKAIPIEITSEEDQKTKRTAKWGVRVSERVFDRVKADKQDDQILQMAEIGAKKRGSLRPVYSIETDGGAILDW